MVVAALWDGPYNVVYLLHIVSVLLGAGIAFAAPIVAVQARKTGTSNAAMDQVASMVVTPALFAAGIFGGALVGMSDEAYKFDQAWLSLGGLVWLVAVAAAAFAYRPSWLPIPDMSDKRPMIEGALHLSLAVLLVLMSFKPGSPF